MEVNKQTEANKKWQQKNKDFANYLKDRSKARSFVNKKATEEDLVELEGLIAKRRETLKESIDIL